MNIKQIIQSNLKIADFLTGSYLGDLTDAEMLARPAPAANHIAWQVGHLIQAEQHLISVAVGRPMPELPPGFRERHQTSTATESDPGAFLSKAEYLTIGKQIRAGTLDALESTDESEFGRPVTSGVPPFVTNVGEVFLLIGSHWIMHTGQWVITRRVLGRPAIF